MSKIDGYEIATKIFERFIDAVRDYAKEMEDAIIEGMKKGTESKKFFEGLDVAKLVRENFNLNRDMVQPLEGIRDKVSECKSPAEFETVADSLIKLFQDKVHATETYAIAQSQPLLDMWDKYLQTLGALALEINDYCVKQYFPMQGDFVQVKIKVSKGFMTPAPYAPIKVYFVSDCIQYACATNQGEWEFKLPKGKEFTFWTSKDGKEASKSVFLSGDIKVKL